MQGVYQLHSNFLFIRPYLQLINKSVFSFKIQNRFGKHNQQRLTLPIIYQIFYYAIRQKKFKQRSVNRFIQKTVTAPYD